MSFLQRFFTNVFHENAQPGAGSSFEHCDDEAIEAHLTRTVYGDFVLTDAVRPSFDIEVTPTVGYRNDKYKDEETGNVVPVLMAAASKERLFETFMETLEPLGNQVDVVLETSHDGTGGEHVDLYRECIDMPVLQSILWDFEDLLLNDGCTGIAVLNPNTPQEVQFDEHKLLIIYGNPLGAFKGIFADNRIRLTEDIRFISEAEHVHSSNENYVRQFEQLRMRLGIDEPVA